MRAALPVSVQYDGKCAFLSETGMTNDAVRALKVGHEDIRNCIMYATQHSIYAYNDDIKNGFVTLGGGVRLGICGEVASDNGKTIAVKNFSSVNIRIPHEIIGFANCIMPDIVANNCSALVFSQPGAGKTTLLRDIARQLSDSGRNVFIVDERGEIACCVNGVPTMDVGKCTDVQTGGSKRHAIECAVRAMRPDVIITDEIFGEEDAAILREAACCGISVIASAHAQAMSGLEKRAIFKNLSNSGIFRRFYKISPPSSGRQITTVGGN